MKNYKINRIVGLSISLTVLLLMQSGCTYAFNGIKGDGKVIKQERTISAFDGIDVGGAFQIFLVQGETEKLVVEADENLMDIIETEVRGSTLKIKTIEDIKESTKLNIYITFKNLSKLDISGASHLTGEDKFKLGDLDLDCSGASEIEMKLSAAKIELECSGASHVELFGSAEHVDLDLSGASSLDAVDLEVANYDADVSGASHGKIFVTGELSADVSGAASLKYKGDAKIVDHDVSGAGSLKKI
jgi:hypothetical protein